MCCSLSVGSTTLTVVARSAITSAVASSPLTLNAGGRILEGPYLSGELLRTDAFGTGE